MEELLIKRFDKDYIVFYDPEFKEILSNISLYIDGGNPCICINKRNVRLIKYLCELKFGKMQKDDKIIFLNENKLDCRLENIKIKRLPAIDILYEDYENGVSIRDLAEKYEIGERFISNLFKKNNLKMRDAKETYFLAEKTHNIAGQISEANRKYDLNEEFFKEITPYSAYIIGFFQADGTLTDDRFSITESATIETNIDHLIRMRDIMGSNRPLMYVDHELGKTARLVVNSRKMVEDLKSFGLHSPRTTTAFTDKRLLDNRDYWRGVIDGDGCLHVDKKGFKILYLIGSKFLCQEFLNFCRKYNCGYGVEVRNFQRKNIDVGTKVYTVRLNGKEAIEITKVLYGNSDLRLERKYNIYINKFVNK